MWRSAIVGIVLIGLCFASGTLRAEESRGYDPLAVATAIPVVTDITVKDEKRSREIPLRVYLPAEPAAAPVVLFSHGLGGSRENNPYLGRHWAQRGYVAVFLQHAGSDSAVWKDAAPGQRMAALREAASLQNFRLRVDDVPAVLDQLAQWHTTPGHDLAGRLDLARVGMSGHSFGANTTQAVSGQKFPIGQPLTEKRITAAVAMSPSSPRRGSPQDAFGDVAIPWLLLTGTKDDFPIGNLEISSRFAVFPALPAGGKYELVLDNAEHSAFGERALPGDKEPRNPNHHRVILALTTAFWDAYLRDDAAAKAWLDGDAPRAIMEAADKWQRK